MDNNENFENKDSNEKNMETEKKELNNKGNSTEESTSLMAKISRKTKILVIIISCVLFINVVMAGVIISVQKTKSSLQLELYDSQELSQFKALNKAARKGILDAKDSASFKFSDAQKVILNNIISKNQDIALTVRIKLLDGEREGSLPFQYGFLYEDDFTSKGKFIDGGYPDDKRTTIHGDLKKAPRTFDISFALKNNKDGKTVLPEGFFIFSSLPCEILAACIVPIEIGFDVSDKIAFYGFSSNGGLIDFTNKSFDFSGAGLIFPVKSSSTGSLPEFSIKLSKNPDFKSSLDGYVYTDISFSGEMIEINNVLPANEVILPAGGLKNPFSNVNLVKNSMCIAGILLRPTDIAGEEITKPIKTDPGLILDYKRSEWRTDDYELFEWDRYPKILFFDTGDYDIQDNFFRRLAYFVEKKGFKGRLLTDEELKGRHGYNAHDYSAISMANFFNKAQEEGFTLNDEELLLKKILIENHLFEKDGDFVKANEGGLVSISQESAPWLRYRLLAHEGWHTIFFRDEEFRNFVSAVYYTMDPDSRDFIIEYFNSQPQLGYDSNDDYLMKNEFMAYIMQQPLSEVPDYFVHLAERGSVSAYTPKLSAYIKETEGRGIEDAAIALNDFVFDKYGIVCGNISLVNKVK